MIQENETEATVEKQQEQTQAEQVAVTQQAQETVESLQLERSNLQAQLRKREDDVRGLNKTLQQRAEESKNQVNLRAEIAGIQDTIELLATAISSRGQLDELEPSERKDILAELKKRRQELQDKTKQEGTERAKQEYIEMGAAIYNQAVEVFGEDDIDSLHTIRTYIRNGDHDLAEKKIAKAKKPAEASKGVKSTETEEQRIERLVDERARKLLDEQGLLEQFSSTPSGINGGVQKALADYNERRITAEEAKKRGVIFS